MADKKDPSKSPRDTGGPVVKSGPTRGENRSRNDDGRWHKKRSDAGSTRKSKEKKAGCFLSTAACSFKGLPDDCHELTTLRRFRDDVLASSTAGAILVDEYYSIAPSIVERITASDLNYVWSVIVGVVQAIDAGHYEQATNMYKEMVIRLTQPS